MIFSWNNLVGKSTVVNQKLHNTHGLKKLLKLAIPHTKKIIIAAICILLINGAEIIKPYILKVVIDDFLVMHKTHYGNFSITSMGIIYFVVVAIGGILSIAEVNLINKVGQEIVRDLRSRVYKTIQLLPLSFLDKMSSGRLITRSTNDVEAVSEMFTDVILSLFQDIFLIIGIVYTMLAMNIKLALVSFSVVPLMFIIVFTLKKKIKQNFSNMKKLIGRLNGFMAENISGMRLIQIFRGEKEKKEEFLELNDAYFKTTIFQVWLNSFLKPAADFLQNIAVVILLWYGIDKISNHSLQIGVLYAFTSYIKQFFNPISDMAENYTTIQSALVSSDRIFELLDEKDNLEDLDSGIPAEKLEGDIEFKHVWFSYDNQNWVLKDISFHINKGETAAFVGETGAGISTIISLINGFYKTQKGEILIDGINIEKINLKDLRKNVAIVLQDVFLFSGNIKNNISLNDEIPEKEIIESMKLTYCYDFANSMQGGINEPVMERGSTFSAGQKQLLSFARAIAHNPSIFVLDEATANIDTHTEKLIQKAIEEVAFGRTTLIIAHRLSTIRNADKIIVLKHGKILESGNHEELVSKKGYYNNLFNRDVYTINQMQPETI